MRLQLKQDLVWIAMLRQGHDDAQLIAQTPFGRAIVEKQGKDWVCIEHPLGDDYAWLNSKFRNQGMCLRRAANAYYRNLTRAIEEATL